MKRYLIEILNNETWESAGLIDRKLLALKMAARQRSYSKGVRVLEIIAEF